jgi:hypothetical protein
MYKVMIVAELEVKERTENRTIEEINKAIEQEVNKWN